MPSCCSAGFPPLAGATATIDTRRDRPAPWAPTVSGKTTFLRTCAGLLSVSSAPRSTVARPRSPDRVEDSRSGRHVALLGHESQLYDDPDGSGQPEVLEPGPTLVPTSHPTPSVRSTGWSVPQTRAPRCGRRTVVRRAERRRVAIAVVIATRPRLWLLDEPHAGLDQRWPRPARLAAAVDATCRGGDRRLRDRTNSISAEQGRHAEPCEVSGGGRRDRGRPNMVPEVLRRGGPHRGRQGSPPRVAIAGHVEPDHPARSAHPGGLRIRPRCQPGPPRPSRSRALLGRACSSQGS